MIRGVWGVSRGACTCTCWFVVVVVAVVINTVRSASVPLFPYCNYLCIVLLDSTTVSRSTHHENISCAVCRRCRHVSSLHSSVLARVPSSTVAFLLFLCCLRGSACFVFRSHVCCVTVLCSQFSLHLAWLCLSIQVISRKLC